MEVFWLLVIVALVYVGYRGFRAKNKVADDTTSKKKNTPYKGTIQGQSGISLKYEVSVREKTASEEKSSELLKEATKKKNEKDLAGAIDCLREAYKLMAQSSISYPIETFLRLPLYLQQAGRYDESVTEFEKLLKASPDKIAKEFSHITKQKQKGLAAMERATIYDKMRLASQREKRFNHAIYFQVLSNATRAIGLKIQKREEELGAYKEREFWVGDIEALLKKAKKETLAGGIADSSMEFSRTCTEAALQKLASKIAGALEISHEAVTLEKKISTVQEKQEQRHTDEDHLQWLGEAVRLHILQAREAWGKRNYDFARQEYQKTAYAMTQVGGQEWAKEKLKEEQAQFAKDDPLYGKIMPLVQQQVSKTPGVLQTSIYGSIPFQKEEIGYALYFGALLNDIRREKKGRTYALYLPGDTYEAE